MINPASSCNALPLAATLPSSLPAVLLGWLCTDALVLLLPLLPSAAAAAAARPTLSLLLPSAPLSAAAPTSPMVSASAARCCSSAMRCAQYPSSASNS